MKVSYKIFGKNNDFIKSEIRLLCFGPVNHMTLISCFLLLLAKVLFLNKAARKISVGYIG